MNFLQSPPNHYPNSQDSTLEIFRTRNFSVTTNASSPPGYHAERAPPRYQEATEAEAGRDETEEGIRKARRIRWIRVASSIFIVTTVSLIVAGVVGKINGMEADHGLGKANEDSTATVITVSSKETAQSAVEDTSSTVDETIIPTASATDNDSEEVEERSHEDTDDNGNASLLHAKSDLGLGLPLREKIEGDGDTSSTCGVTLRPGDPRSSRPLQIFVEDAQAFTKCLMTEFSGKTQDGPDYFCNEDCSVENLVEAAVVDEWEWDSG